MLGCVIVTKVSQLFTSNVTLAPTRVSVPRLFVFFSHFKQISTCEVTLEVGNLVTKLRPSPLSVVVIAVYCEPAHEFEPLCQLYHWQLDREQVDAGRFM